MENLALVMALQKKTALGERTRWEALKWQADKHAKVKAAGAELFHVYLQVTENSQFQFLLNADDRMNYIMKNKLKMQREMVHVGWDRVGLD